MSFDFSEKKKYVAIYGEIRNLGKIQRRQGIQSVLNRINEEYNASFTLNEGYYIEGILTSIDHLPKILLLITNEFLPLQVVYGVAIGEGSEVDCSDVFNLAKEALYNVINLKHKKEKALSNIMLLVQNDKGIKNIA